MRSTCRSSFRGSSHACSAPPFCHPCGHMKVCARCTWQYTFLNVSQERFGQMRITRERVHDWFKAHSISGVPIAAMEGAGTPACQRAAHRCQLYIHHDLSARTRHQDSGTSVHMRRDAQAAVAAACVGGRTHWLYKDDKRLPALGIPAAPSMHTSGHIAKLDAMRLHGTKAAACASATRRQRGARVRIRRPDQTTSRASIARVARSIEEACASPRRPAGEAGELKSFKGEKATWHPYKQHLTQQNYIPQVPLD